MIVYVQQQLKAQQLADHGERSSAVFALIAFSTTLFADETTDDTLVDAVSSSLDKFEAICSGVLLTTRWRCFNLR